MSVCGGSDRVEREIKLVRGERNEREREREREREERERGKMERGARRGGKSKCVRRVRERGGEGKGSER